MKYIRKVDNFNIAHSFVIESDNSEEIALISVALEQLYDNLNDNQHFKQSEKDTMQLLQQMLEQINPKNATVKQLSDND